MGYSGLQSVAEGCGWLWVTAGCKVLPRVAGCCRVLQGVAGCCSVLQRVAVKRGAAGADVVMVYCRVLQSVAECCRV